MITAIILLHVFLSVQDINSFLRDAVQAVALKVIDGRYNRRLMGCGTYFGCVKFYYLAEIAPNRCIFVCLRRSCGHIQGGTIILECTSVEHRRHRTHHADGSDGATLKECGSLDGFHTLRNAYAIQRIACIESTVTDGFQRAWQVDVLQGGTIEKNTR